MQLETIFLFAVICLIAGVVKGTVGIGLPTIIVSLMSSFIDPRWAMSLVIIPIFASNLWQFYRSGHSLRSMWRLWPFVSCLALLNYAVSRTAFDIDADLLLIALGFAVVLFALNGLLRKPPAIPKRWDKTAQLVLGSAAGILGGLTTIWGPPMVVYLLGSRTDKASFVAASGFILTVGSVPLLFSYAGAGLLDLQTASLSTALLVPALCGFWLGEKIRARVDTARFFTVLLVLFLALGLNLIRRAVM